MSSTHASCVRINRIGSDYDITRLNSVGLSLKTIGAVVGIHPTSVMARLVRLKVPAADTRRAFMEDIFVTLNVDQQEWVADAVQGSNIKDFVRNLLIQEYQRQNQGNPV
jgi:hypothetical protein